MGSRRTWFVALGIAFLVLTGFDDAYAQPRYEVTHIRPALGDLGSIAYDINKAAQVVGWSVGTGVEHAYFWERGRTTALPPFANDGILSSAYAINDAGQVVGESTGGGFPHRAALWTRNDDKVWQVENLGTLPGYYFSRALDIDEPGKTIAGFVDDALVSHAAVWEYNGAVDPPWRITDLGLLPGHEAASARPGRWRATRAAAAVSWPSLGRRTRAGRGSEPSCLGCRASAVRMPPGSTSSTRSSGRAARLTV